MTERERAITAFWQAIECRFGRKQTAELAAIVDDDALWQAIVATRLLTAGAHG